jgi:hypothetical protein
LGEEIDVTLVHKYDSITKFVVGFSHYFTTQTFAHLNGGGADNSDQGSSNVHMFGVRIGKTFKNVKYSPTLTLWFDSLSGNDDDDAAGDQWGGFNSLADTGHKFYGFMDQYLAANNLGTGNYGLQDMAVKTKWKLGGPNTLKIDVHHFETQSDLEDGDTDTLRANDLTAPLPPLLGPVRSLARRVSVSPSSRSLCVSKW